MMTLTVTATVCEEKTRDAERFRGRIDGREADFYNVIAK